MWSLPDIATLNKDAASAKSKRYILSATKHPKKVTCEFCDKKSAIVFPYFDVFSEDAKGVVGLCHEHFENYGGVPEGYFECDHCGKLMIDHYTWERYEHNGMCLNCARDVYLSDPTHWIDLTDDVPTLTFAQIRKAPHLFAHGQNPKQYGLWSVDFGEFDSMTGEGIYGSDAVGRLNDALTKAKASGHKRAVLIMDGAYQFAVKISVFVELEPEK